MNKATDAFAVFLFLFATCSFVLGVHPAARAAIRMPFEGPSTEDRRAAVRNALPYLARQAASWIEKSKCTSCHQIPHTLWAINEARTAGFAVDKRMGEWNRWAADFVLRETDEPQGNEERASERADEISQLLLSGIIADTEPGAERSNALEHARTTLISLLKLGQQENGSWLAGGRLPGQKRPEKETEEVTTLWSLHALRSAGHDGDFSQAANERAMATVVSSSTSIEHLSLRYILAGDMKRSEKAATLRSQIISYQNGDGGWGWLLKDASDAMAT